MINPLSEIVAEYFPKFKLEDKFYYSFSKEDNIISTARYFKNKKISPDEAKTFLTNLRETAAKNSQNFCLNTAPWECVLDEPQHDYVDITGIHILSNQGAKTNFDFMLENMK